MLQTTKFFTINNDRGSINFDRNLVEQLICESLTRFPEFELNHWTFNNVADGSHQLEIFVNTKNLCKSSYKLLNLLCDDLSFAFKKSLSLNTLILVTISDK